MQPLWQPAGDEHDEPAEDRHEEDGDAPKRDPDQVRDGEDQPEEDSQPRTLQVVLDDHADGVRLHRHGLSIIRSDAGSRRLTGCAVLTYALSR